jgi:hypothetical protein
VLNLRELKVHKVHKVLKDFKVQQVSKDLQVQYKVLKVPLV